MYVCQVDEIKRSMFYLKPRQDLNIFASPSATSHFPLSCTLFPLRKSKGIRGMAGKHLTCDCPTARSYYSLSIRRSPFLFSSFLPPLLCCAPSPPVMCCFPSLLHCHLVTTNSRRYLTSSLHPGKHRPLDASCIISLNDPDRAGRMPALVCF